VPEAKLHDGSTITVAVEGQGPTILMPVKPVAVEGPQADEMRKWGADPNLGRSLIDGLSDAFRVVAFDYEGHVLETPKADTLTPDNVAADLLAVADAAGADRFAWYGFSWHAVNGLQLAVRTDRLTALIMGGYPPLDGPNAEMLATTTATHEMATGERSAKPEAVPEQAASPWGEAADDYDWSTSEMTLSEPQTRQFVTYYRALRDFDDRAAQAKVTCPKLCFAGSADEIDYDERWGGVKLSIGGRVAARKAELESLGWEVRVLDGLDHMTTNQSAVILPIIRPWLLSVLRG
jgi:pimeloyl-ACP methyl ester carboxylesterase